MPPGGKPMSLHSCLVKRSIFNILPRARTLAAHKYHHQQTKPQQSHDAVCAESKVLQESF